MRVDDLEIKRTDFEIISRDNSGNFYPETLRFCDLCSNVIIFAIHKQRRLQEATHGK